MVHSLKLVYKDDIRKVSFESLSIATLYDKIRSLFSGLETAALDDLYLYYIDDENDKIRIKFDLELEEALRQFSNGRVLKIYIIDLAETNKGSTSDSSVTPFLNLLASLSGLPAQLSNSVTNVPYTLSSFTSPVDTSSTFITSPSLSSPSPLSSLPPLSSSDLSFFSSSPSCDFSVNTSPLCSSVSTNTLVDAKDVATETPLQSVTQTTQTAQNPCATQTTQTTQNACTTQTTQTQNACATQTTQTAKTAHNACATQTAKGNDASQGTHASQTTQCEAQVGTGSQPSFYDCIIGTQFGNLLDKLQELGFNDKEMCARALVKHSGKLDQTIDELLMA